MRTTVTLLLLAACGGDVLADAADAEAAAVAMFGGEAGAATEVTEDDHALWSVPVTQSNGAVLEVYLFVEDGALFEGKDFTGPFDYAGDLAPLDGQLGFIEARDVALGTVDGEVVAWKVEWEDGPYYWEFYVEESGTQLWEVKLWADDGEVFVTEPKEEVD